MGLSHLILFTWGIMYVCMDEVKGGNHNHQKCQKRKLLIDV